MVRFESVLSMQTIHESIVNYLQNEIKEENISFVKSFNKYLKVEILATVDHRQVL